MYNTFHFQNKIAYVYFQLAKITYLAFLCL